ncbi:cysteine synthase A [Thermococci archaeon]|nr:MAG: cysteine synthase A [Thermococci archaeon]
MATILDCIGNTPLVKLKNREIYLKLEGFNPGGSVKDRVAYYMINKAEEEGILKKDTILIEPSSGNTGIGLALVATVKGYRLVIVMPETMSIERRKILELFGAEILLTGSENPLSSMETAIEEAKKIAKKKGYLMLDQFSNENNVLAHYETTAPEIWKQTSGNITHFVAGIGTGGTITGVGKFLKEKNPNIKIIGVLPKDPIQGLKNIKITPKPKILNLDLIDEIIEVSLEDSIKNVKKLAVEEGIFAGFSSGAATHAALQKYNEEEGVYVVILPDGGMRYLSML